MKISTRSYERMREHLAKLSSLGITPGKVEVERHCEHTGDCDCPTYYVIDLAKPRDPRSLS